MDTSIDTTVVKQQEKEFSRYIKLCMAAAAHADFQIKTSKNDDTYTQPSGALRIPDYFSHPGHITLDITDLTYAQKHFFYNEEPGTIPNSSLVIQVRPKISLMFHDVPHEPSKEIEGALLGFSAEAPEESSSESSHTEENSTEEEQDEIDDLRYQINLLTEKKVLAPLKTDGIHIKISPLNVEKVIQTYRQLKQDDQKAMDQLLQSYPSTAIRTKLLQKSINDHYLLFLKELDLNALHLLFSQESEYTKFSSILVEIQTLIKTKSLSKDSTELSLLETTLEKDDALLKLKDIINHTIQVLKRRAYLELKELIEPQTAPAVFRDATKIVQAYKKTDPNESSSIHKKLKSLLHDLKTIHKTINDPSITQNNTFQHLSRARAIESELFNLVYTVENKIILQLLEENNQLKQAQIKIEQPPMPVCNISKLQPISEAPAPAPSRLKLSITPETSTPNKTFNPTFMLHCLSSPQAFKMYGAIIMMASLILMGCVAGGVLPLILGSTVASTGLLLGGGCFFMSNHTKKSRLLPTLNDHTASYDGQLIP